MQYRCVGRIDEYGPVTTPSLLRRQQRFLLLPLALGFLPLVWSGLRDSLFPEAPDWLSVLIFGLVIVSFFVILFVHQQFWLKWRRDYENGVHTYLIDELTITDESEDGVTKVFTADQVTWVKDDFPELIIGLVAGLDQRIVLRQSWLRTGEWHQFVAFVKQHYGQAGPATR